MPRDDSGSAAPERRFSDYLPAIGIAAIGLFIMLAAADVIPSDPKGFHAPRWVVGMFGLLFLFAGLMLGFSDYPRIKQRLAAFLVLIFSILCGWMALFSEAEEWSGGIPFLSPRTNGMIAKTLIGLFGLLLFYAFIRLLFRKRIASEE